MKSSWDQVLELARTVDEHYSMWEEQQELLYHLALQVPKDGIIVELGVAYGKTSVVLASAAKKTGAYFHAVDDFSLVGSSHEYRDRMKKMKLMVRLHPMKTQEVSWSLPIDLLIIDAGHDRVNVRQDCEKWIPFVVPGGVVAFHDYEQVPPDPATNPHWAVQVYADQHTGAWEEVAHIKSMMVRRRPST